MLKPIFEEDVNFFLKKIILTAKGGDFNSLESTVLPVKKSTCDK